MAHEAKAYTRKVNDGQLLRTRPSRWKREVREILNNKSEYFGTNRYCRQIVVAFGVIVIGNQASTQLADHFSFLNFHRGKQAIAGARDRRLFNDGSGFVLFVYF